MLCCVVLCYGGREGVRVRPLRKVKYTLPSCAGIASSYKQGVFRVCQLGLFGYTTVKPSSDAIAIAIAIAIARLGEWVKKESMITIIPFSGLLLS